jgi:hypothetical protein
MRRQLGSGGFGGNAMTKIARTIPQLNQVGRGRFGLIFWISTIKRHTNQGLCKKP